MASLTRNQQLEGQRHLLLGAAVNPLGASIVMGPVVSLLALHYGAGDFSMGLIYATVYITCLLGLLPPLVFRRFDISSIMAWAWIVRACVGGGFLVLPFIENNDHKIVVLILTLIAFASTRAVGACAMPPIMCALNRSSELTRFIGSIWSRWYFGVLCATACSYVILQNAAYFPDAEYAYISLLAIAFILNMLTGILYARLPKIGTISGGGVIALARAAQYIKRNKSCSDVVLVCFYQVILAVAAAYQMSHMQGALGFSSAYVFALTLGGLVGAFAVTRLVTILGDSISFRLLLLLTHVVLAICSVVWLGIDFFADSIQAWIASGTYVCATTFLALSACVLAAMSSASLPYEQRVEVSTLYMLITAVSALIGLGLISMCAWLLGDSLSNPFAFAYIPWLIFSICVCLWALRQKSDGDPEIKYALQQLKPSNIQSLYHIQRVTRPDAPRKRNRVRKIENALLNNTPSSRETVLKLLQSSHVTDRLAACYSLFENPYTKAYPIVVQEALDPYSPLRCEAITALGLSGERHYASVLEGLLTDDNPRVRSNAAKGLLRLDALTALPNEWIFGFYTNAQDYRQRLDVLIGLSENKQEKLLRRLLIADGKAAADARWLIAVSLQWVDTFGKQTRLSAMLQLEEERAGEGVADLLQECASAWPDRWKARLETWTENNDIRIFADRHPDLQLWPMRTSSDLLLQILLEIWPPESSQE